MKNFRWPLSVICLFVVSVPVVAQEATEKPAAKPVKIKVVTGSANPQTSQNPGDKPVTDGAKTEKAAESTAKKKTDEKKTDEKKTERKYRELIQRVLRWRYVRLSFGSLFT